MTEFTTFLVAFLPPLLGPLKAEGQPLWDRCAELFGASAAQRGLAAGEVIEELKFSDSDTLIRKNRWSAFHDTKLALSLRTRGIDTIILAGGAIESGIVSTAFQARDMDFGQVIVRDACTSLENDVGDMFMEHIYPRFARIRATDETVEMMRTGHARGG